MGSEKINGDKLSVNNNLNHIKKEEVKQKEQKAPNFIPLVQETPEDEYRQKILNYSYGDKDPLEEWQKDQKKQKSKWNQYKQHWKDDFKEVGEAEGAWNTTKAVAKSVAKRTHKGFETLDVVNPFTYAKMPFKSFSEYMDKLVDDGDDEKLALAERMWNAVKGGGNVIDYLTSAEGIEIILFMVATGGAALESLPADVVGRLTPFINAATTTGGGVLVTKGTVDVITADTPEEAQKGGGEILSGSMMIGAAAATSKQSLDAARHAGVPAKDPTTLTTGQAMVENFRVAPQGVKIAFGLQAPTVGAAIPASAIHMVSKPNQVEAYVNTGKADGIVFEGSDGKLYVPNKWSPAEPYEVKPGSVIMIYDEAGGDFAVCDPEIFAKTYVGNSTGEYNAMKGVEAGKRISATKQAVGGVEIVPEGTTVKTLEGPRTVGKGEVVCYDVDGNPYVSPLDNVLKRNTGFSDDAIMKFCNYDPVAVKNRIPEFTDNIKSSLLKAYDEIAPKSEFPIPREELVTLLDEHTDVALKLASYQKPNGTPLFNQDEINSIMFNCESYVTKNPEAIYSILDSEEGMAYVLDCSETAKAGGAFGVWKYLYY